MDVQVATDTSSKLCDVKARMKEKRCGSLKSAKQNASLASKIKNKIINNSSIIKVSLKQNNRALALALNSEKALGQKLIEDKTFLMKEIEVWVFKNARLRRAISHTNKVLRELEAYISAKLLSAMRESDPYTISEDIGIENLFIRDNANKHRNSSPNGSTKSSLKDPTTDVENGKQPDIGVKDLFLQLTKSPQTQHHLGLEEPSNFDGENKQVNALSILESELTDLLSVRKDDKTQGPYYENKSPLWANITQSKKCTSSSSLNCQIIAVDFETDVCSHRFSRWTIGPRNPSRETNGQEASNSSQLSDLCCDLNSHTSLPEDATLSEQLSEELVDNNRCFSNNKKDRSFTTSTKDQNKIKGGADKDVASPLRSVKCGFMEQEVQDTVGMHPIKNSDNNSKKHSQSLITLSPVVQTSSKLTLISSVFPTEMNSLGENPTPTSSGPPKYQLYQVSDRIRKCRQTYLCSEVCPTRQEKIATPSSGKRRETFSEKEIEVANESPNSSCDPTCKSPCERSGMKQLSQKNKVPDKQIFSNEINREIKQIGNRMSTYLHNTVSEINDSIEKSKKESENTVINMDQQIPNARSQAPHSLACVRMPNVEILQKMTNGPLKQEMSRRTYDTEASDHREENMSPLECNLKADSQEHTSMHKTKGREIKQRKACLLNSEMDAFHSNSRQSNIRDSPSRKKQSLKSHVGSNSRIPRLASRSVEPGLTNVRHASVKSMKDIQNNVNKKQTLLTVQVNATRDMSRSMKKAKQKVENVLKANDQTTVGKKGVSGEHEPTEVGQVRQNEVHSSLSKTEKNSQRATKNLFPNSLRSLEPSNVILSQERPVRTSLAVFQVLEPHLVNGRVLTTPPAELASFQITKGGKSPSGPEDSWSAAVLPRGSSLSKNSPKKDNQELHNLENTRFSSPIPTSKFLRDSRTTLRRSARKKEHLVSYREPRLNCKLRRGDPFTDTLFLHSPVNRRKEIVKNSKRLRIEEEL